MRPTAVLSICGALLVMGCRALDAPPAGQMNRPGETSPCHLVDCREAVYAQPIAVPDGDEEGTLIGPLRIADDGASIRDVALELEISHPCPADLSVSLTYDRYDDGTSLIETPIDLYLGRADNCGQPPAWACDLALTGTYWFRDDPEIDALSGWDAGSLASFRGLAKGGSFYLRVVDAGPEDLGTVQRCAVYVR